MQSNVLSTFMKAPRSFYESAIVEASATKTLKREAPELSLVIPL